jgi:predicted nuclease with TOPRIM domain
LGLNTSPLSNFKREDGSLQRLNVEQIFVYDGALDGSKRLQEIDESDDLKQVYDSQVQEFEDDLEEIGEAAYKLEMMDLDFEAEDEGADDLEGEISPSLTEKVQNLQQRYDDMLSRTVKALKLVPK